MLVVVTAVAEDVGDDTVMVGVVVLIAVAVAPFSSRSNDVVAVEVVSTDSTFTIFVGFEG